MRRRSLLKSFPLATALLASGSVHALPPMRAPAEEHPHAATWMAWPHNLSLYEDRSYFEDVQQHLGRLARAISRFEPVFMAAPSPDFARVRELCGEAVTPVSIPTNDMWMRDSGPVFVRNSDGALGAVDFNFNGWGDKQQPRADDEQVAERVCEYLGIKCARTALVGEGGGLEYDGEGTLLLSESCWLNENRNPGIGRHEMTAELKRLLGVEKVIWLPGVRDRDITDGHIDGSIRFVRPGVIMTSGFPGDVSDWGATLDEGRAILARETDARGRSFELVDIPGATDASSSSDELFTGYANYYVANGAVFTPRFGDRKADARALELLGALFPDREVVPLELDRIYECGGGIHCVTQQQPAV
ncbi:MAG: agmatine deiminase family protein [Pseudomonadota bacterium]